MPEKKHTGTTVKAKGIICMTNLDCMWGLVIAPPEASGCAEQQKVGDAWASSGLHSQCTNISTLRRKWKQEGGGAERGWGIYRQFIYAEHQPTAHCLKDKGSECFMPDGKQRQQFKTICIQHMHPLPLHLSVSVSWLILKHNPFGAPTCHNISIRPLSRSLPPFRTISGGCRLECFIATSRPKSRKTSLWFCLEEIYIEGHEEKEDL